MDYQTSISAGPHTLKLWVDNRNEVQEETEDDNVWEMQFSWNQPEITYTGQVTFWDLNPPPTQKWARQVLVEMWDKDGDTASWLDSDVTDDYGVFELGPVANTGDTQDRDGPQQDVFFSVKSRNTACEVGNSLFEVYKHSTPVVVNHRSGVFDTLIQIPPDSSGAFYVADAMLSAREECLLHFFIPSTNAVLDLTGMTEYIPDQELILVDTSSSGWHPETWDEDVILHEYGHRVADWFDFLDAAYGPHAWDDTLSLNLASAEGWANFFAGWVTNDYILEDHASGFTDTYFWNCETGQWG